MANEVIKVELLGANNYGDPLTMTCASGTTILKGTIVKITDPRTISASTGTGDRIIGITAADKDGTDFSTSVPVWTNGIFDMVASNAITAGDLVKSAAGTGNQVMTVTSADAAVASYSIVIGTALETATDGERIQVRVLI